MSKTGVVFYYSSVSSNQEIKKQQQRIKMVLDSKNIGYKEVDVAASEEDKSEMKRICDNPSALPPQICNGDTYCGNYQAFDDAIENEKLKEFLKLK